MKQPGTASGHMQRSTTSQASGSSAPVAFPLAAERFFFRLIVWLTLFAAMILSWGLYNGWPPPLFASLLLLPCSFAFALRTYRRSGCGFHTAPAAGEWELLAGSLLLTIGIASGVLLLMAIGWLALGISLLRPHPLHPPWSEWFKLPLLLLLCWPLELDLAGSRHDWFGILPQHLNPHFWPNPLFLQLSLLSRFILLGFAWFLPGASFWITLPALPLMILSLNYLLGHASASLSSHALTLALWLAYPLAAALLLLLFRHLHHRSFFRDPFHDFSTWISARTYSTWLAALVVAMQQSSIAEHLVTGGESNLLLGGIALWAFTLWLMRRRSHHGPVSTRSRVLLVASLFILLIGEWTDLHWFRHLALGLLLIALASWRCRWSISFFSLALASWILLIPAPRPIEAVGLPRALTDPSLHLLLFLLLWFGLCISLFRPPTTAVAQLPPDNFWQPAKRLSFILLGLLLSFQFLSAWWPNRSTSPANTGALLLSYKVAASNRWQVGQFTVHQLNLQLPPQPIQVVAPEWLLEKQGWHIADRELVAHPRGQAALLHLRHPDQSGAALYWFNQQDQHAFVGFHRGRRILWSGWNLTYRDVRLHLLWSPGLPPHHLLNLARDQWSPLLPPSTPAP